MIIINDRDIVQIIIRQRFFKESRNGIKIEVETEIETCSTCKHAEKELREYPCSECNKGLGDNYYWEKEK